VLAHEPGVEGVERVEEVADGAIQGEVSEVGEPAGVADEEHVEGGEVGAAEIEGAEVVEVRSGLLRGNVQRYDLGWLLYFDVNAE
jgi:hypothetical protein